MLHFLFISCSLLHGGRTDGKQLGLFHFRSSAAACFSFCFGTNTHVLWWVHHNWTLQLLCPSGQCSGNGPSRPWWCSPRRTCLWSDGCSKVWWFSSGPPVHRCPVWTKRESFDKKSGLTLWVFRNSGTFCLLFWLFACVLRFPSVTDCKNAFITPECTHTLAHAHCGLSPAVTPRSRQMGDICSLEIFLHYCHRGTSLNVCFPAPVLMRMCLLKWWSTWQKTFTRHHARTDHMCDSVLSSRASRVMFARCTTFAAQNKVNSRLLRRSVLPDIVCRIHTEPASI